jgi:hypothetical protein
MKRFLIILIIVWFLLPLESLAANSDSPLKMEELAIQVMPEYSYHPKDTKKNHPPLLIGYQGTFINTSDKAQKGMVKIPIPTNLKDIQIGFVADYSSDLSEMYEIEYEFDQDQKTISWQTTNDIQPGDLYKFVIEFYSNEIKDKSNTKSFKYTFKSFTDIDLVNITFLEPLKTESTVIKPAPETHQENPYGMNMFMYQIPGMKTGEEKSYQLTYKRSSTNTTVELMNQIDPNKEEKTAEPKKVESNELYMVIGGVGVFSLISAFLLIVLLKNKNKVPLKSIDDRNGQSTQQHENVILRNKLIQGEITKEAYEKQVRKMK